MLILIILSSLVAFLPFNFPKSRVFMGDSGSVLIGFVLGFLMIYFSESLTEFLGLSMFLGIFYADSSLTIIRRLIRRENIFKAHKLHLYQALANEFGFAHWKVSTLYFILQIALSVSSLYLLMYRQYLIVPLFVDFTFSAEFT